MPEEDEYIDLDWDDKYGTLENMDVIGLDSSTPVLVARLVGDNGNKYLAFRKVYVKKDGVLRVSKGLNIPIEGGIAEEALLCAEHLILEDDVLLD